MLPECFAALVVFDWSLDPWPGNFSGYLSTWNEPQAAQWEEWPGRKGEAYLRTAGFPLHEDCRIVQLVPQSQKYLRQLPHRPILPYFASPSPSFPQRFGENLSSVNFWGMHTQKSSSIPAVWKARGFFTASRAGFAQAEVQVHPLESLRQDPEAFWFVQTFRQT